jgi:hypothetical protein
MKPPTLREREGRLYIVIEQTDYNQPKLARSFYPTGLRAADFKRSYGEELVGQTLREIDRFGGQYYIGDTRLQVSCVDGGKTMPEFTEIEEIPAPRQRGRKLETKYFDGAWHRRTARGWAGA